MAEAVAGSLSLKDTNAKRLLAVLALNAAAFYLIDRSTAITLGNWAALATGWMSALPAGVGVTLTAILNSQISSDNKARLVFWRWHFPYPGSEAFTRHGPNDVRVDMDALEKSFGPLPTDRKAQNVLWYKLYRTVADTIAVSQAHRQFLFARDYAFMSLIMLPALGAAALTIVRPLSTAAIYIALLIVQWALTTNAANVSGHRFVTTVLAQKGAGV